MSEPMPSDQETSYGKDQVVKIINSVLAKVEGSGDSAILTELQELQKIIEEARSEIGMTSPGDIKDKHIPTATDELDAVVGATEEATGTIMDCCDAIMEQASSAGEAGEKITAEVMKVYEACSFQDITGQRITKVVKTLKDIDEKVDRILSVMGAKMPGGTASTSEERVVSVDDKESLLNGPQMPDQAISQDDIDSILAEFDE